MIYKYITSLLFSFFFLHAGAQVLDITMEQQQINPGDSIHFTANYTPVQGKPVRSTLLVLAINDSMTIWEKRYPLIGVPVSPAIYVPNDMPVGNYKFRFVVMEKFFSFKGKVMSPGKVKTLDALLVTNDGKYFEKVVSVKPDSTFIFTNVLFQDEGILSFNSKKLKQSALKIKSLQVVDSIAVNVADVYKDVYVGVRPTQDVSAVSEAAVSGLVTYFDQAHTLEVVKVITDKKTNAERLSEAYSTPLFQSMGERLLDMTNEPGSYTSIFPYLQGRIAGLQINAAGSAMWRMQPVQFYVDEMRADADRVAGIPVADIALVKAFPPPFFGNFGGSGGAIAIYTRRGEDVISVGNNTFKVTGYTALESAFSVGEGR